MNRRRLTGAVLALAVHGVPAVAHADDDPPDGELPSGEPTFVLSYFDVD